MLSSSKSGLELKSASKKHGKSFERKGLMMAHPD
jgi:hypothetical protein